jgi:hypothetical protein
MALAQAGKYAIPACSCKTATRKEFGSNGIEQA